MDLLAGMHAFAAVADANGFAAAARRVGLSQAAISKRVAALERHLGVRLIARSTRSLVLTAEGQRYLPHCREMLRLATVAANNLRGGHGGMAGLVRIASPSAFARRHVARHLPALLRRWPELEVELIAMDDGGDLVGRNVDVAIRFGELPDGAMIGQRIGTTRRIAVASRRYLEQAGLPRTPADLASHNCLIYTPLASSRLWQFNGPRGPLRVKVSGNFATNSSEAIREAARADLGIAVMPDWLFGDRLGRDLSILLPRYEAQPLPIHLVHPTNRDVAPRIRSVIDHLAERLSRDPALGGRRSKKRNP